MPANSLLHFDEQVLASGICSTRIMQRFDAISVTTLALNEENILKPLREGPGPISSATISTMFFAIFDYLTKAYR